MSVKDEGWHDPENYRAMSVPHESPEAANAAIEAFLEDVLAARKKHRIADVHVCAAFNVKYETGEGTAMSEAHFGDSTRAEAMLAHALGRAAAHRREMVNLFLEGKNTGKRK